MGPVVELHQRHTVGLVLVVQRVMYAEVRVGEHLDGAPPNKPPQSINSVAPSRQQAAASNLFLDIPLVLRIPGSKAMEVVHLPVEQTAHNMVGKKRSDGFKERIPA